MLEFDGGEIDSDNIMLQQRETFPFVDRCARYSSPPIRVLIFNYVELKKKSYDTIFSIEIYCVCPLISAAV